MITTPASFRDYFQKMAADFTCSFSYGSEIRILNRQLSQIQYPLFWLEQPTVRHVREGVLMREYRTGFLFLNNVSPDDEQAQDEASEQMFNLAHQALLRLETDADAGAFIFDISDCSMDIKEAWSPDDDYGWRVEIVLLTAIECEDCE